MFRASYNHIIGIIRFYIYCLQCLDTCSFWICHVFFCLALVMSHDRSHSTGQSPTFIPHPLSTTEEKRHRHNTIRWLWQCVCVLWCTVVYILGWSYSDKLARRVVASFSKLLYCFHSSQRAKQSWALFSHNACMEKKTRYSTSIATGNMLET